MQRLWVLKLMKFSILLRLKLELNTLPIPLSLHTKVAQHMSRRIAFGLLLLTRVGETYASRMAASIFDMKNFAQHLEAAYQKMWDLHE